jgi:glycosyltransferase involved in cell wall biosynthesis
MRSDVILAEPWYRGSHRRWADGYLAHTSLNVTLITSNGGWKNRMLRAGSEMAAAVNARVEVDGDAPGVVLASSMMNVEQFRAGLWHRGPVYLYMHENQLTYPGSPPEFGDISAASVRAADRVFFNSEFHRDELLRALGGDRQVAVKSGVLPVGTEPAPPGKTSDPPIILWNHRWEADKRPDRLATALAEIADLDWRLALAGEHCSRSPVAATLEAEYRERLVHAGYADDRTYRRLLAEAAIVVSTADQEFFGLAMVEAMAAGAYPVLPNRLSYPELIPPDLHDRLLYPEAGAGPGLRRALSTERRSVTERLRSEMRRFDWARLAAAYDHALASA